MYEGKANPQVEFDMLLDKLKNVDLPNLENVLRYDNVSNLLLPANGAIAILLRMGSLDSKPDFDEIKTNISMWYKKNENEIEKTPQ